MAVSIFEERFKGGHPNSLGNTIEIVDEVLADKKRLQLLIDTWFSDDEIVRLRVANAVRRVCVEKPDWIETYIDLFTGKIAAINQPSTQWTIAKLFELLGPRMNEDQKASATTIMKNNLENHPDWIVLNNSMETLALWAHDDPELKKWLLPQLTRLTTETRKSVAGRAAKLLTRLGKT